MPTALVDPQTYTSKQFPSYSKRDLPTDGMIDLIRDVNGSPTVLIQFLERDSLRSLPSSPVHKSPKGHRKHHSGTGSRAAGHGDRERITAHLESILQATTDRLEHETRRAEEAIARAEYAEVLVKEWFTKAASAEKGRSEADTSAIESEHSAARYRLQLENTESALKRLQADAAQLEKRCAEAERSAVKARSEACELQTALNSLEAKRKGWEEGVKTGITKRLGKEKDKLWNAGYAEGIKEGKSSGMKVGVRIGRREGLHEGREQGRNEERRNALEAFDMFLAEETDGRQGDWTRRWAASVYHATGTTLSSSSHSLLHDETQCN
ncbi:hypothetical protein IW261DRAFT_1662438 [Armillaria novae-zelandiae]|uniref:Uncharacterized protein n=1 Tax=Armillaria novae-zelandiae TaxID=153914 RepID=A0AA39UJW0_9AGAR|nr:hypothetical protein IW261DRAFT_1662438 [Armillaria novae-zelandiae]